VSRLGRAIIDDGRDRSWMHRARCQGMADEVFFPTDAVRGAGDEAKAVCRHCPVIEPCLEFGLGEDHGIWGGTNPLDRRRIRRERRLRRASA
jgi:WhiB family redox-sensing transcriptional regulator